MTDAPTEFVRTLLPQIEALADQITNYLSDGAAACHATNSNVGYTSHNTTWRYDWKRRRLLVSDDFLTPDKIASLFKSRLVPEAIDAIVCLGQDQTLIIRGRVLRNFLGRHL